MSKEYIEVFNYEIIRTERISPENEATRSATETIEEGRKERRSKPINEREWVFHDDTSG